MRRHTTTALVGLLVVAVLGPTVLSIRVSDDSSDDIRHRDDSSDDVGFVPPHSSSSSSVDLAPIRGSHTSILEAIPIGRLATHAVLTVAGAINAGSDGDELPLSPPLPSSVPTQSPPVETTDTPSVPLSPVASAARPIQPIAPPTVPTSPPPEVPTVPISPSPTSAIASNVPETPVPSVETLAPPNVHPTTAPPTGGDDGPALSPTELPTASPTSALPTPSPPQTQTQTPSPTPTPTPNIIFNIQTVDDSAKKYVRGDKGASPPSAPPKTGSRSPAATTPDKETHDHDHDLDGSDAPTTSSSTVTTRETNVIGGRTRDNPVNALAMSKNAAAFHDAVRYVTCTVAGISVALLLFFHYVSLDPGVDWSKASAGLLWAPNTWEFVVYLGYLQQMGSLSQLDLSRTPYFLWDYTDAFSWSVFLVRTTNDASSLSRRLDAVVVSGVVAFGDRIGVDEDHLLSVSSLAFVLVFGVLFLIYVAIVLFAKRKAEDKFETVDEYATNEASSGSVYGLRFVSLRFLGLCVLIWLFALYPLSLFSTFEIAMQVDAHMVSTGSLVLAIFVLGVVCFGVLAHCARELYRKTDSELTNVKNLAVWGSLYAAYTFRRRLFFVVVALVQLSSGVLIGAMTTAGSATALIVALLGIQVVYLVAVFFQAGFVSLSIGLFTFALGVVKISNYAIAFAFLDATDASSSVRSRAATAFVVLNSVVLLAWFVRHAIMLLLTLRALSKRDTKSTVNPRGFQDSGWFSQQPTRLVFHEEDDDALLPEMVEFQTPVERDSRATSAPNGGNVYGAASELKAPVDGRVSDRGSTVFVMTMAASPIHDGEL